MCMCMYMYVRMYLVCYESFMDLGLTFIALLDNYTCMCIGTYVCIWSLLIVHLTLVIRDTTVQTLTLQPSVQSGIVTYQDSPLVSSTCARMYICMYNILWFFNPLTPIVHFWASLRTRPRSLAHKQCIGVCPIALESAVFKEWPHLRSLGIGHSQRELCSVKEAIQSCVR